MRRYDSRLIIGVLLVLGGILALLDTIGIISDAWGLFGGVAFGAGGLAFLYMLINDRRNWWAAFPAFTLLGLSLASFLPESLEAYDRLAFFLGISLAFWWVYFTNPVEQWWAIIPGGVLLTLGAVFTVEDLSGMDTGWLLFLGLGVTFLLVALLPGGKGRSWGFIPGIILVLFGSLLATRNSDITQYLLPAALIAFGGYFLWRFFANRPPG